MRKCERLTKYLREHNIEEDTETINQTIHVLEFFKKDLEEHTPYSRISIISLGEAINQLEQYNSDEEDFMDNIENEVSPKETDESNEEDEEDE